MIHYVVREGGNYTSSASYNRVRLMCGGLAANGIRVNLHLLLFIGGKSKLSLYFNRYISSYFKHLFQLLIILSKVSKDDIVIVYDTLDHYWLFPLFRKRTNLVIEHTEYPSFEINERIRFFDQFYSKKNLKYLKYASLLITCSSFLRDYYSKFINDIIIIPLVVDESEYNRLPHLKKKLEGEYIAYCGSFNNNKDGLPILLESFKVFHMNHPQVKLVLIGSGAPHKLKSFNDYIIQNNLSDVVLFTGSLPHEEVAGWLEGATMLALARPNNLQARGGVPSKVGEYLASGVPCVITRTGDLPTYLNDGIDCFLCEPDSAIKFAQRLEDCYASDREKVGKYAKDAALQFNNTVQAKQLASFLNDKFGSSCLFSNKD